MAKVRPAPGTNQFPCDQCGALQTFAPGSGSLACPYCGYENAIHDSGAAIVEYDFREALHKLAEAPPATERQGVRCESCAAAFAFAEHVHAGECPFCGTPIVQAAGHSRPIKPRSLLPFRITEDEALTRFREWIKGLWFAPGKIKRYARGQARLAGVYVPYWTYDSDTATRYRGERGDAYYVTQAYTATVNGKRVRRTRRVRKIRWTPVSGRVARFFDDVLVGASQSLPRRITDRLAPWDLDNLVPYDDQYLSGFSSEIYQVGLDEGFDEAVTIMNRVIRADIARDIGGDEQRIRSMDTRHRSTTFKHLLLPVWSAGFTFRDKTYRFVVNGRTGQVQGERPWSVWKVGAAVIAGLVLAVGIFLALERSGALQ